MYHFQWVLPFFPVKIYPFEIFTRATPGSSLVINIQKALAWWMISGGNIYQILSFSLSARKRKGAWNDWSERDFPSLLLPFTIYRLLTEFSIPPAGSPHIHESCPHSTSFIIYTNTSIHCHPLCHSCLSLSRIGPSHLASPLHQRETIHDQECERY